MTKNKSNKGLSPTQREKLFKTLQARFQNNMERHKGIVWTKVAERLQTKSEKLWNLYEMERTGGEPDVVAQDKKTGSYTFYDCSAQSPKGRRSLCYDRKAQKARKEHAPKSNALDVATEIGITLLNEEQYRKLQMLGEFDTTTSSWIETPEEVRKHGGAVFCDRRYNTVFLYHNGADSYYAARGFRGALTI